MKPVSATASWASSACSLPVAEAASKVSALGAEGSGWEISSRVTSSTLVDLSERQLSTFRNFRKTLHDGKNERNLSALMSQRDSLITTCLNLHFVRGVFGLNWRTEFVSIVIEICESRCETSLSVWVDVGASDDR